MSQRHSILVVEDDAPTRARLERAIATIDTLMLIGSTATCVDARDLMRRNVPDVLLTDLGLPDGRGDELIRELMSLRPQSVSLVITMFGDEPTVLGALEAGASGYLLKDSNVEKISEALRQLLDGGAPLSPSIARFLLKRFGPKNAATSPKSSSPGGPRGSHRREVRTKSVSLTARELEVLNLAAKGFSFGECAELLGISRHTVTTHVRKVYRKLTVTSRSEAIYEANQLGLLNINN